MDADAPKLSINLAQDELDRARAQWSADKARRAQGQAERNWAYPAGSATPDEAR